MKLGLLGFGTVGRGVYELTAARDDLTVAAVVRRSPMELPGVTVSQNFQDILDDPTIDTVVESIGGLHPAREYVRAAILAGKNVVTANKALVAEFYDELLPLCEEKGVLFRCTASVGGGIGWLSELERVRRCETITQVGGIMNGTCNYILDAMTTRNLTYADALRQAQELGYAEADPSTDVDGIDTWHKLIISCNVAFGVSMDSSAIPVAGVRHIKAYDVEQFRSRGYVCKLVSYGARNAGVFNAYVQPTLFTREQPESTVPTNYNLITLVGTTSGRQSFLGQGAGRYPTAYNVVQDCLDFLAGRGFYGPYGKKVSISNQEKLCYYVRGDRDTWLAAHTRQTWGEAAVTEPISVQQMHQWHQAHPGTFIAALPRQQGF